MSVIDPESDLTVVGRMLSHHSWANTTDRTARTAPARAALEQKWLDQANGDAARAEDLKRRHYAQLGRKSAEARRAKKLDEVTEPPDELALRRFLAICGGGADG